MPRYDYEVLCKDIRPDGSTEITIVVSGARDFVEKRLASRLAREGKLRGTLISFSAKRIPGTER